MVVLLFLVCYITLRAFGFQVPNIDFFWSYLWSYTPALLFYFLDDWFPGLFSSPDSHMKLAHL